MDIKITIGHENQNISYIINNKLIYLKNYTNKNITEKNIYTLKNFNTFLTL